MVDCRRISTISIVIAGIAALSVCRWYVAVQCRTGLVPWQIGTESCYRVGSQAYRRDRSVGWTVGVAQSLSSWVVVRYQQQGHSGGSVMLATGLYS